VKLFRFKCVIYKIQLNNKIIIKLAIKEIEMKNSTNISNIDGGRVSRANDWNVMANNNGKDHSARDVIGI
jgi:hypothetical protein